MVKSILFFILLSYLSACTAVSLVTDDQSTSVFALNKTHKKKISVTKIKEFYLWGLVSPNSVVNIHETFREEGSHEVSSVKASFFQTGYQKFISWLSFGFYIPQSYELTALTLEDY